MMSQFGGFRLLYAVTHKIADLRIKLRTIAKPVCLLAGIKVEFRTKPAN